MKQQTIQHCIVHISKFQPVIKSTNEMNAKYFKLATSTRPAGIVLNGPEEFGRITSTFLQSGVSHRKSYFELAVVVGQVRALFLRLCLSSLFKQLAKVIFFPALFFECANFLKVFF